MIADNQVSILKLDCADIHYKHSGSNLDKNSVCGFGPSEVVELHNLE